MAKMQQQTRESLLPFKDVEFPETGHDGEPRVAYFRIYKMPATEAESWLGEVLTLALRCGIPIPRGQNAFDESMMAWAGQLARGDLILKLTDLNFGEVQRILNSLFKYVRILLVDPDSGDIVNMLNCTPNNINDHVCDFKNIFKLRLEVIGFTYGFFDSVEDLGSKVQALRSNSSDIPTSRPSSEHSSLDSDLDV